MDSELRKEAETKIADSLDEFIAEFVVPNIQSAETNEEAVLGETELVVEPGAEVSVETNDTDNEGFYELLSILLPEGEEASINDATEKEVQEEQVLASDESDDTGSDDDEPEESEESDSDDDESDAEDDDEDWLNRLFGRETEERSTTETAKKSKSVSKKQTVSVDEQTAKQIESLRQQVESLTQFAQMVMASVQLENWVNQTAKIALEKQEELAKYGIQLSEDEIMQAMLRASTRALQDPKAFEKEIRPTVLKKMAQTMSQMKRIPTQPQSTSGTRSGMNAAPESFRSALEQSENSFEQYLLESLEEIRRKTG